ncbi:hypothetical protein [Chryseobacterium sp. 5_R23647]|uniref:hypothetical protein n=1 Tax=Chryseobacterium sp. 5_R23647 TaxID=2258964 RepID=UPI000E24D71A|nr:hypothetical protein [Chryseobacterium sp. 5_R23647]REC45787.1 hypothetical protein DRF69_01330 [Chryseobacterium sp. 5_R23647]
MENVKKFNPNFEVEEWCFETLKKVESVEYYKFYNSTIEHKKYVVPVDKIVGTTHWSYIGRRWIDLPYQMKRFRNHYNVNSFLEFVKTEDFTNNDLSYIKYGDCFFISGGNHRTSQAKFSNLKNITTEVIEFVFDKKMYNIFQFLKSEGLNPIISEGGDGKHYDFCSWTIQMNTKKLYFHSFKAIQKFVNTYIEVLPNIINVVIARLSKSVPLYSYNEQQDYSHLKYSIILHKLKTKN